MANIIWLMCCMLRLQDAAPLAKAGIQQVVDQGFSVEWVPTPDFMTWMLQVESTAEQQGVQVKPHIVDTAALYPPQTCRWRGVKSGPPITYVCMLFHRPSLWRYCVSSHCAMAASGSEQIMGRSLAGGGAKSADILPHAVYKWDAMARRLKDVKHLLRATEPAVLDLLIGWRKARSWVYANHFAQCYVLSPAWQNIRDVVPEISDTRHLHRCFHALPLPHHVMVHCPAQVLPFAPEVCTAQAAVMRRALQLVDQAVVDWEVNVPRVARCDLTLATFTSMCTISKAAVAYYKVLKGKHKRVWESVPEIERCFVQMCIHGDSSMTEVFQASYDNCGGRVSRLDMLTLSPDSDWATALRSLQTCLDNLAPPAATVQAPAAHAALAEGQGAPQASLAVEPMLGTEDHRCQHRDLLMVAKLAEAHLALDESFTLYLGAPREPVQASLALIL